MANFYDQPAQAQFINTYIPIPFEEIAQAATTRYQRHQQGLAGLESMLSEIENITPYSDPDKEKVKSYRASLQEIVDKYGSGQYDLGSPQVIRDISKDVKKNIDRKVLTDINKNYELATRYNELALQNQTPREFLYDWKSHDTSTSGLYTGTPERGLDSEGAISKFFNEVNSEFIGDEEIAPGIFRMVEGRSLNKLQQHVYNNTERLIKDPAINQLMRRKGLDPTDVNALNDMLIQAAPSYRNIQKSSPYNLGNMSKDSDNNLISKINTLEGPGITSLIDSPYKSAENIKFDEFGKVKERRRHPLYNLAKMTLSLHQKRGSDFEEAFNTISGAIHEKDNETIVEIQNSFPGLKGLSPKQTRDAYLKGIESQKNKQLVYSLFDKEVAEAANTEILQTFASRGLQIMDKYGVTNLDNKKVLNELGYKTEDDLLSYIEKNNKLPISFTQDGDSPGMFIYQVPDKRGKLRNVLIEGNQGVQAATQFSYNINKAKQSMLPQTIPLSNANETVAIRVEPDIDKEGNVTYKLLNGYKYPYTEENLEIIQKEFPDAKVLNSSNGEYIFAPFEEMTEDELRTLEINSMVGSLSVKPMKKSDVGTIIPTLY